MLKHLLQIVLLLNQVQATAAVDSIWHCKDNFTNNDAGWPIKSDQYNLFVVQDSQLYLSRVDAKESGLVLAKVHPLLTDVDVWARFSWASDLRTASFGLAVMVNEANGTGILIEVNNYPAYRVRYADGKGYQLITGRGSASGWVNFKAVRKRNSWHEMRVKSNKGNYEVYIDQQLISTFTLFELKEGKTGLIIGAQSAVQVSEFGITGTLKEVAAYDPIEEQQKEWEQEHKLLREKADSLTKVIQELKQGEQQLIDSIHYIYRHYWMRKKTNVELKYKSNKSK
jgi:hypothetical protein